MDTVFDDWKTALKEFKNSVEKDLEEIRRIAIDEFGMKYAEQDQIVIYSDTKGDSVRQIIDSDRW